MRNIRHLVGCPGAGKTSTLMGWVGTLLKSGLEPGEIVFTSFTRAATEEARGRAERQFGLRRTDLPYFGTLHSLAYRHLMLNQDNRLTPKRWKEFCEGVRLEFTETKWGENPVDDDFGDPLGSREGDVLRRFYDWQRGCLLPVEVAFRRFDLGGADVRWTRARVDWFIQEFESFKTGFALYDFTDMLLEMDEHAWTPAARVLLVDEAQDLSPLQQRIVLRWAAAVGSVILSYDEDQAIFAFQGAAPEWLMALPGQQVPLTQSYRVPEAPARVAQRIIGRNRVRYGKTWKPKPEAGQVRFDADLWQTVKQAADPASGTWYLLARNRCYLDAYCEALKEQGIPYENLRGHTPEASGAVLVALQLASGEEVTLDDLSRLSQRTTQAEWWRYGAKAELARAAALGPTARVGLGDLEAWGATPALCSALASPRTCLGPVRTREGDRGYFRRVFARYGAAGLTAQPRVTVSTFHGVKGGGARNVVMHPSMTRRTADSWEQDPEPERRVWYVGASRTEANLFVLEAGSGAFYDEW